MIEQILIDYLIYTPGGLLIAVCLYGLGHYHGRRDQRQYEARKARWPND